MSRCLRVMFLAISWVAILSSVVTGQVIDPERGADPRVDYRSLDRFGPWDDRNYHLTAEDLALLPADDPEQSEGIPAFYRVILRRTMDLRTSGPAQYPRSALPRFLNRFGGYLYQGRIYRNVERLEGRWVLTLDDGLTTDEVLQGDKALNGEARVTNPTGAAESAVAFNPLDTDIVIAGSNGPGTGQRMHFSSDGGETWTQAAALPLGGTCCDPTVAWSSDGTKAYTASLGSSVFFYRSGDNGQTWDDLVNEPGADPRREIGGVGADKEYLHVDTHSTSPHLDSLYLTWHEGNVMQFARSTDSGHTWSAPIAFGPDPRGLGSDITTDTAGNIYYFYPAFVTQQILVKISTDGGVSFGGGVTEVAPTQGSFTFPVPSMETREVVLYVSADTDRTGGPFNDSIYVAWTDNSNADSGTPADNHARIQVAYSRDGGATWTVTSPHETADVNSVDRYHQWLSVGPDGTVYVIFYDTRQDPTRESVDIYHAFSTDGAQTWSLPARLTTVSSPNITDGFEFGDYNGLDVVMNDLIAIFTDNRTEGAEGDSVDVWVVGTEVGGGGTSDVISTGGQFAVSETAGSQEEVAVAARTDGTFVAVWRDRATGIASSTIKARHFDATGSPTGPSVVLDPSPASDALRPAIAAGDDDFLVVWHRFTGVSEEILAHRLSSTGGLIGSVFQLNSYTTGDQSRPVVAADSSGEFLVVWQSAGSPGGDPPVADDTSGLAIVGRRVSTTGTPLGSDYQVNSYTTDDQACPSVVERGGFVAVAWQSGGASTDVDCLPSGIEGVVPIDIRTGPGNFGQDSALDDIQLNTSTISSNVRPKVAMRGNEVFVVWEGEPLTEGVVPIDIQGRRYSFTGLFEGPTITLGDEVEIDDTADDASRPDIAVLDGGFLAVTWDRDGVEDGEIFGKFGSSLASVAADGEFQVNTTESGTQKAASLAATPGGFVVLWQSDPSNGGVLDDLDILGQRYELVTVGIDPIFDDGFESGDTTAWSSSSP